MSFYLVFMRIITSFISQIILLKCYESLCNKKFKFTIKNLLITLFLSVVIAISNVHAINNFRVIISLVLNIILIHAIFKDSFRKNILYALLIFAIGLIFEILFIILMPSLGITDIEQFNKSLEVKLIYSTINSLFVLFVCHIKKIINYIDKIRTDSNDVYIILYTVLMIFNLLIITIGFDIADLSFHIITDIILLVISLLTVLYLKIKNEKHNLEIYFISLSNNISLYEKVIDEYRILKHNLKNDLLGIKSISDIKTNKYIDEILKKYNTDLSWISSVQSLSPGIRGLIYYKLNEAATKKINYVIDSNIKEDFTKIMKPKLYEMLCTTLGVCLDNAIYAAINSEDKNLYIGIIYDECNRLNIRIINNFSNSIDINNIGKKNYSTKEIKSGLGLYWVNNYKKIKVNQTVIDNKFITQISI